MAKSEFFIQAYEQSNCKTHYYLNIQGNKNCKTKDTSLPSRTISKTFSSKVNTTVKEPSAALSCQR
ncbi:hypothetical protein OIU79_025001 [Salix purpurea]|uniref:Uncharacterized protein n=1 Tax=Salix purpurea TaxID=77065 RepID=A0A9Q1A6U9_SALPP|nr:hypothetical protein OIU79_025001 [Salix purpurea]